LKLNHTLYMGMPEEELNPTKSASVDIIHLSITHRDIIAQ
jgi:hypothetical protein